MSSISIGITGTQLGLTLQQQNIYRKILNHLSSLKQIKEIHHGDCIGADSIIHNISIEEFCLDVVIHPPFSTKKRAFNKNFLRIVEEKQYLERNKDIVDQTDILFAFPKDNKGEAIRSGTWSTVRYARKQNKKIIIIRPDGSTQFEN